MFKEHAIKLLNKSFIYGVGQVLTNALNVILLPIFTAYLSPSDYGIASLLAALTFICSPFFSLGFGAAIGSVFFRDSIKEQETATIGTAFKILLYACLVFSALVLFFSKPINLIIFGSLKYTYLFNLTILQICLSTLLLPFTLYLQFKERAKTFVIISLVSSLSAIILSSYLIILRSYGVRGLIEGSLFGTAVNLLITISVLAKTRFPFNRGIGKELFKIGFPLIPGFAFLFILSQFNKYILQWSHGLTDVGIYSIGLSIGTVISIFLRGIDTAWLPFFMSFINKKEEAIIVLGRILTYYVYIAGTATLFFFIFAKPVIILLTQSAFHNAYLTVGFAATSFFLSTCFTLLLPGIYYANEVKYVSLIQAIAAILSIMLYLILIPALGLLGASISLPLGYLVLCIVQYVWNRRRKYLPIKYEWTRILKFGLVFICYSSAMLWNRDFNFTAEFTISTTIAICLLSTIFFLLDKEEKKLIFTFIAKFNYSLIFKR